MLNQRDAVVEQMVVAHLGGHAALDGNRAGVFRDVQRHEACSDTGDRGVLGLGERLAAAVEGSAG